MGLMQRFMLAQSLLSTIVPSGYTIRIWLSADADFGRITPPEGSSCQGDSDVAGADCRYQ
jgi:hypothetical protein